MGSDHLNSSRWELSSAGDSPKLIFAFESNPFSHLGAPSESSTDPAFAAEPAFAADSARAATTAAALASGCSLILPSANIATQLHPR